MHKVVNVEVVASSVCWSKEIYQIPSERMVFEVIKRLNSLDVYTNLLEYEKRIYRFKKFIESCDECQYIMLLSTKGLLKYNSKVETESIEGRTIVFLKKEGKKLFLYYAGKEYCISLFTMMKIYLCDRKRYVSNLSLYVYGTNI